ncbi:tol-pal system protein YbgF [Piscinibacter sakaiensis]|uniref:tol-pal system protein YbgF n=1 Tax=Piscinibacter sakaiensis TaxID=1547922 RepID=UPI003AACD539
MTHAASATATRWRSPARLGAVAALLAAGWLMPAQAALFEDDEARRAILDLRQRVDLANEQSRTRDAELAGQLKTQRTELMEQITQLRRTLLDLNNELELLRGENARLRGQSEQLGRDIAELQRAQKDIRQGIDERIRQFEPQKVTVDGVEFTVDPDEKRLYEASMAQIRAGDFNAAAQSLAQFQQRYPASGYNESVLYWLGNAQYARRDCKAALGSFRSLVTAAPNHLRAPEAMLSIANCQSEQKDPKAAKKTLEDLVKTYPKTEAATAARERLAAMK